MSMDVFPGEIPDSLKQLNQWVVWRYESRGDKPTKVPYQVSGQHASSTDPLTWCSFKDALAAYQLDRKWSGIGLVFSAIDDLVGIDLDDCIDDEGEVLAWAQQIIDDCDTYTEISPSGRGVKMWVRGHLPGDRGRRAEMGAGHLEVYSQGRYFTVTGDRLVGTPSEVQDAQEAIDLISTLLPKRAGNLETATRPIEASDSEKVERARRWLEKAQPAISGCNGHLTTMQVVYQMAVGFDLSDDQTLHVLQDWNARCQPPWTDKELRHKIASAHKKGGDYGFKLSESKEASYIPVPPSEMPVAEPYIKDLLRSAERSISSTVPPSELFEAPGFIGKVADYIDSQNHRSNRLISLVGALMCLCALTGRKIKTASGLKPALYTVLLAPSGAGKQTPQDAITKIMLLSDQANLYIGDITSGSALCQALQEHPARLCIWDEFGRFLRQTRERVGGIHMAQAQKRLLELWAHDGGLWKPTTQADSKLNRAIYEPCCSIFGLTVPSHFWSALEESHLHDGFLARLLIIDTGPKGEARYEVTKTDPPAEIIEVATYWRNNQPGGNLASEFPRPRIVQESPNAVSLARDFGASCDSFDDDLDASIWARALEKARRLALLYAASRDHECIRIDSEAMQWGISISDWSTKVLVRQMREQVVGDDRFSQIRKKVLQTIEKLSMGKHLATRSKINRDTHLSSGELTKVLESLIEADQIEALTPQSQGRGRPATYYRLR